MSDANGLGVVSLFSGAGGLDAGLERAGFTTLLAIDNDPDSIATLSSTKSAGKGMSLDDIAAKLNAKKVPAIHGTNRWTAAAVRKAFVS